MLEIGELKFLMMSISATFNDYNINSQEITWACEDPFICITADKHVSYSPNYKAPPKKSNRGRKKKIKVKTNNFKSNISFILNNDTEYKIKNYNIRIFNGGGIVCVGILQEDKSDFYYCLNEVKKFIIRQKLREFENYDLPPEFFELLLKKLDYDYSIHSVYSTLENYQFHINYYIDIFRLKDYFVQTSEQIINVDFEKFYTFVAKKIMADDFELNAESLVNSLEIKGEIKREFVSREKLILAISGLELSEIKFRFATFWTKFLKRNKHKISPHLIENIKFSYLKQFFINCFESRKNQLMLVEYSLVENVRFKEAKHTLIVEKKKEGVSITVRIFSTGTINIQGGNSRELAEAVYKDFVKIFLELQNHILFLPDKPPMIPFEDFL